jgi:flagellar hook-basal body complex protein FliE
MNSEIPFNPNPDQTDESTVEIPMEAIAETVTDVEFSEMLEIPAQEESLEPVPLELTLTDFSTTEAASFPDKPENEPQIDTEIGDLEQQKASLQQEIQALKAEKEQLLNEKTVEVRTTIEKLLKEGLRELEQRKQSLEVTVEQLERRQEKIRQEMRTTFAGASQDLAIRVQGFKDYLVGSLQDLVSAADQLELGGADTWNDAKETVAPIPIAVPSNAKPNFAEQSFEEQRRQIQRVLEQYRTRPDYYGPPWQLRRTFEPIHAERVQNWFFGQGGRGVVITMGSRLQNILVGSSIIAVIHSLYGDRSRALILANTPERLGEWRRGLQDCLGISRADFGPERGVVLFESPEALIQKAERLVEDKQLPLVIIDEAEDQVNLALLQFPLWLAFAPDPQKPSSNYY